MRRSYGDDLIRELEKLQQGTASHYLGLALHACVRVCMRGFRIPVHRMILADLYLFKMSIIFLSHLDTDVKVGCLC